MHGQENQQINRKVEIFIAWFHLENDRHVGGLNLGTFAGVRRFDAKFVVK